MASKDYFNSNPTLDTTNKQNSLDPQVKVGGGSQGELDPGEPLVGRSFVNREEPPVYQQPPIGQEPPVYEQPPRQESASFFGGDDGNLRPHVNGVFTSETPVEIVDEKAKKKRRNMIIALVAVIVLVLGCGGVFGVVYYQNQQAEASMAEKDREAAQEVANMIASIGEVSLGSGDAITKARSHYDVLTEEQKAYIPNLAELTAAEQKYDELKADQQAKEEAEAKAKAEKEAAAAAQKSTLVLPTNNSYYGCYQVITQSGDGLVLRYGPSTSYNKILTVPYGTYLDVYGWSGEWAYVSYGGKNGWVNSNYLY